MIPLRVGEIIFLYLFLFLVILFVVWISSEHTTRSKHYEPPVKRGFRCPICAYTYTADRDEPVHRCPRCSSLQE